MMVLKINLELITKNLINDRNLYKKEDLRMQMESSKYQYKDMLYKELIELANI